METQNTLEDKLNHRSSMFDDKVPVELSYDIKITATVKK